MLKVENINVWGFDHAVRAMRNPLNSWDKSDSEWRWIEDDSLINPDDPGMCFAIGKNDLSLMNRLFKAGSEQRTYARMIQVCMDIVAPLYWWKEMDRYTVGKSQISCSTMHKIADKEFELDDFSHEHLFGSFEPIQRINSDNPDYYEVMFSTENIKIKSDTMMMCLIELLNFYRKKYIETKDKVYWWQLIQLLPSSYNQRRTICMSYETVFKIIKERTGHKLDEWNDLVQILTDLPCVKEIMNGSET